MLKALRWIFTCSLLSFYLTGFASALQINLERVKQTCHCIGCDLQQADLNHFQPGSENPDLNPFLNKQNDVTNICWLSCDLSYADLSQAQLKNTNFTICLRGYQPPIAYAKFNNTNFMKANLSHSVFYGDQMQYADFSQANLSDVDFSLADLAHANFTQANLSHAKAIMDAMHGWGADFSAANFTDANLKNARLYGAFKQANFTHANLENASLSTSSGVLMQPKALHDPWQGVNFTQANLRNAKIKTVGALTDLTAAIFCHTIMPEGKINNRDCKN